MRFGLLGTFFAAVSVITWDELKHQQRFPHPEVYVYVALVWAILGIVGELGAADLAALFGLGIFLTMLYTYVVPTPSKVGHTVPKSDTAEAPRITLGPGWN